MTKKKIEELLGRKFAIEAQTKGLYAEADQIESQLIAAVQAADGGCLKLGQGRALSVRDNFVDREGRPTNKTFKTACVKRFELVLA